MPDTGMMQKIPSKQETGTSIFSDDVRTEQKSALFMKKLLAVAVSNITYLRGIYPERAYGDRCLEDLKLKILREESSCPGACQLIKWVKGCFDALDKKFLRVLIVGLRVLIVGIYTDSGNPDMVIESYSFKFSYTDDNAGMDVYRNDEKISSSYTAADTMRAAANLLRTIVVVIQSLKVLPADVKMTMKLLYYDDVTPSDYEPPGFKAAEYNTFHFEEEPVNFKVGDVSTPFHTVQLKIKTDGNQFLATQEENKTKELSENMEQNSNAHTSMIKAMEQCDLADKKAKVPRLSTIDVGVPQPTIADQVPVDAAAKKPEEQAVDTTGSQSSQLTADGDNGVRCQCGCNETNLHSTDPSLHHLSEIALQATCLWRRTLLFCTEVNEILAPAMGKRLGVELVVARGLLSRLEKETFVKGHPKKKRLGKIVDKEKLKDGIQKYFKKSTETKDYAMNTQDQIDPVDNDVKRNGTETKEKDINHLTAKAKALDVSEKAVITQDVDCRLRKRNRKRGKLLMNGQECEYELGHSQELSQEGGSTRKRQKKASIVATP